MRILILPIAIMVLARCFIGDERGLSQTASLEPEDTSQPTTVLQPNTLCDRNERVIFSCPLKRPAKIVSVCAAKDLTSDRGYLQYRFGLPGKIELEFPKERTGTQTKFQYTHYFRAQVDLTETNFNVNGYEYQVTDDYNGEEKPAQTIQGVSVTTPGKPKEVTFICRAKPKADYTDLQAVLGNGK